MRKTSSSNLNIVSILIILLGSLLTVEPKVSYENIKKFSQLTYDQNQDELISWKQFCDYFILIEPDHKFAFHVLNSAFNAFDVDKNGIIRLDQFLDFQNLQMVVKPGPKQIHLGLTENQSQMQVMWISNHITYDHPSVFFGQYATKLNQIQKATMSSYNVGHVGFHGRIYRAVMKNLKPEIKYFYKVGDSQIKQFSQIKHFKAPSKLNSTLNQIRIAIFGDHGTFVPFGHLVSKMIAQQNSVKPYDFVFLTGDIAYAGISSKKVGELEPVWDLYGQQTQSFAAYTAFMPGVGNHQSYYNFQSYFHRYRLPRVKQNQTNLWFSFDYGQVHMVYISSEHKYSKGSEQYEFLQQDLKKASQNPHTKWIILGGHRAFYCSDSTQYSPISPLTLALQQLINKYKVDIVQNGHLHAYERTWPVIKGKALKANQSEKYYINPASPVYVVQGTAGALINQNWIDPSPQWSMKRILKYGYGQITIKANYLKYEYISLPVGKVVDTWYIVKEENESRVRSIVQGLV